jgi:plasmid stability protein
VTSSKAARIIRERTEGHAMDATTAPHWSYNASVPVSLSIKDVPDELAEALRARAARNHRSLQGELMHILEFAVGPRPFRARELAGEIRTLGLSTPDEAVAMIREDRNSR